MRPTRREAARCARAWRFTAAYSARRSHERSAEPPPAWAWVRAPARGRERSYASSGAARTGQCLVSGRRHRHQGPSGRWCSGLRTRPAPQRPSRRAHSRTYDAASGAGERSTFTPLDLADSKNCAASASVRWSRHETPSPRHEKRGHAWGVAGGGAPAPTIQVTARDSHHERGRPPRESLACEGSAAVASPCVDRLDRSRHRFVSCG